MAVSRALRRLLRIRDLQEEQGRLALEASMGELNRLEDAMKATENRDRMGRRLLDASARSGELPDRVSGIEESRTAARISAVLTPRIEAKQRAVHVLRQEFLEMRVARRQAETLIEEAESADAIDAGRREQQGIDGWYSSRVHQARGRQERAEGSVNRAEGEEGSSSVGKTLGEFEE